MHDIAFVLYNHTVMCVSENMLVYRELEYSVDRHKNEGVRNKNFSKCLSKLYNYLSEPRELNTGTPPCNYHVMLSSILSGHKDSILLALVDYP